MITKVYAEIGFGNSTFLSTEFETGKKEKRVSAFRLPENIKGIYLRIWIKRRVIILSTIDGFKTYLKNRVAFKFLFGVEGVNK